jgi:protein-disulfide isomerase
LSDKYKNQLKIVIKHFPLTSHKFARKAAQASLAAHKQGKFWEFHTKLFENYQSINDGKIVQIAGELKLDIEKFQSDMNLPEIQRIINRDIQNGRRIGVRGTPTIFINGKRTIVRNPDEFMEKIDSELKKISNRFD